MESRDEIFEKLANFGLLKKASFSPASSPQEMQKIASDLSNEDLASQLDRFYKQAEDATYEDNDKGESQNTGEAGTTADGEVTETSAGDSEGGEGLTANNEDNDQGESQNASGNENEAVAKLAFNMSLKAQQIRNNLMGMYQLEKEAGIRSAAGSANEFMKGVGRGGTNQVTKGVSYLREGAKNNPKTAMGIAAVGGATLLAGGGYGATKGYKKYKNFKMNKMAAGPDDFSDIATGLSGPAPNVPAPDVKNGIRERVSKAVQSAKKGVGKGTTGRKVALGLGAATAVTGAGYGSKKLYDRHKMNKQASVNYFDDIIAE